MILHNRYARFPRQPADSRRSEQNFPHARSRRRFLRLLPLPTISRSSTRRIATVLRSRIARFHCSQVGLLRGASFGTIPISTLLFFGMFTRDRARLVIGARVSEDKQPGRRKIAVERRVKCQRRSRPIWQRPILQLRGRPREEEGKWPRRRDTPIALGRHR